jgi:hypothetical protein
MFSLQYHKLLTEQTGWGFRTNLLFIQQYMLSLQLHKLLTQPTGWGYRINLLSNCNFFHRYLTLKMPAQTCCFIALFENIFSYRANSFSIDISPPKTFK